MQDQPPKFIPEDVRVVETKVDVDITLEDLIAQKDSPKAINNYGIDYLDRDNPTVKDQIFRALTSADRDGMSTHFDNLFSEKAEHIAKVKKEDLIATYDALVLRTRRLDHLGKDNIDVQTMKRQQEILGNYLSTLVSKDDDQEKEQIDLSDNAIAKRVSEYEKVAEQLLVGFPEFDIHNIGYKSLVQEAAKVGVYHQDKDGLLRIIKIIEEYHPDNIDEFKQRLQSVSCLDIESDPFNEVPDSKEGGVTREDIIEELDAFIIQMEQDGFEPTVTMFFGSASEGRARSKDVDPEDPSDIDLFMVVPDENLNKVRNNIGDKLGRKQDFYNSKKIESFVYFVPSVTDKLQRSECFVYSESQFRQMLDDKEEFTQAHPERINFLNNALKGKKVQGNIPAWIGDHFV